MGKIRILIVEDDENILIGLRDDLLFEGFSVDTCQNGREGLGRAIHGRFDLIILDVMLPDLDGFDLCRELRHQNILTPIIMLTARGQESDKIVGLELGADDYMTKPFSPRELVARIRALLRRTIPPSPAEMTSFTFGDVTVDFESYEVMKDRTPVHLTGYEFSLLKLLILNRGKVLHRHTILDEVWGPDVYVMDRTVDTHIGHLRKKLEDEPFHPRYILGVRSVGYKFLDDSK